jgi:hypothetical protein
MKKERLRPRTKEEKLSWSKKDRKITLKFFNKPD